MLDKLRTKVRRALGGSSDPHPLTLAVPDARSTFNPGDVGWARRPPATVGCPQCGREFVHQYATDIIRCPTCRFECQPERFGQLELIAMACPECDQDLEHGVRHPHLFEMPQWASCPNCQYHWEIQHSFSPP